MIYMTLNQIYEFKPCEIPWNEGLKLLGKNKPDDTQVSLLDILQNMIIEDVIWCMRVNWFEHKELYMTFTHKAVDRARHADYRGIVTTYSLRNFYNRVGDADLEEVDSLFAVKAISSALCTARYLGDLYGIEGVERAHQYEDLKRLLLNHKS